MGFSFDSHDAKASDPWSAVHGLLLLLLLSFFFFPQLPTLFFFAFTPTFFLLLPPTPNPLPSGKRALRFASPGFYPPPLLLPIN